MVKRTPQGRGSGGRVTESPRARARVPTSSSGGRGRAASGGTPAPTEQPTGSPSLLRRIFDPAASSGGAPARAVERVRPWWGFGDVVLWWVVAQLLTMWLPAVAAQLGGYAIDRPVGPGARIGELVGELGTGQAPVVTRTWVDMPLWLTQAVLNLPLWSVMIGGAIFATVRKGFGPRRDLKLDIRAMDVPIGLAIGFAAQLVLNPLVYRLLFVFTGEQDVSAAARRITDRASSPALVLLVFVTVGLVAPFAEELFFRGLAMQSLMRRFGPAIGLLLSSAFFTVTHANPLLFVGLFPFAVILGLLVLRTDRLGPAIAAHVGYNLVTATVLVFGVKLPW